MDSQNNLDSAWLEQFHNNDPQAVDLFVETFQIPLFRFCEAMTGSKTTGEELAQESFLKALRNRAQLSSTSNVKSWLFTIAKNTFLDGFKTAESKLKTKDIKDEDNEGNWIDLLESTPDTLDPETKLDVQSTLMAISPEDRAVLILVDQEEYSYAEAGKIMKMSENAMRSRVHRARKSFLSTFEKLKRNLSRSKNKEGSKS